MNFRDKELPEHLLTLALAQHTLQLQYTLESEMCCSLHSCNTNLDLRGDLQASKECSPASGIAKRSLMLGNGSVEG